MTQVASNLPATRPANSITKAAGSARFQNEDDEDTMLPRIHLYQGLPSEAKQYGRGFEPGDLINTLTGEKIASKSFVPIFAYNQWIVWKEPRGSGIEFQTRTKSEVPPDDLQWNDSAPPRAQKYMNFVVLFDGTDIPMALSFTKTSMTAGRSLNTLEKIRGAKGPGLYEFQVKERSNDKGTWQSPIIRPAGNPSPELAKQAVELFASMNPAAVTTNIDAADDDGEFNPEAD